MRRDPVAVVQFGGDPKLEFAIRCDREVGQSVFAEHAVTVEMHVAVDEREDRGSHSGHVAGDAVGRVGGDRRPRVDVVGIRPAPLRPGFFVAVEYRRARIAELELALDRQHELARDVPYVDRMFGIVERKRRTARARSGRGEPVAELAPRKRERGVVVGHAVILPNRDVARVPTVQPAWGAGAG